MFIGSVIDDEINEHAHPALLTAMRKLDKVAEGAVARINPIVVRYVIAIILTGGWLEGHEPNGSDADTLQIVQATHQSLEVTDAVSVSIHIGCDRKAIDDGVLVPEIVDHSSNLSTQRLIGAKLGAGTGLVEIRNHLRDLSTFLPEPHFQMTRVTRHADTAGGLSGVQLPYPVLAGYLRIIADPPDQGGQTGDQMAASEIRVYGLQ